MIDQPTIDRILDAAQIYDVVSDFVTLRKRGVNYVGLCPFHDDKTPSFYVSPAKGLCKCFACGKGGNAVHFIMEHEQMSYPEALKYLAKKYGIEIKERELSSEEKIAQSERESLFIVNNFDRDYFQNILKNHVDGQSIGMAYFRSRGFRDDIIEKFQLGYCTESHDALAQEALKKGYKKDYLVKTGLCYETADHRLRDRFWGRVIFPVHTLSGKVVAFGGRVLAGATKVVLLEPVEGKREVALKLGADLTIDSIHEDVPARLKQEGVGNVDVVIECVGKPVTIEQAIQIAGHKATVMMFGLTKPDETITVKPFEVFQKELVLTSSYINPYTQRRALELIDSGRLDVSSMVAKVASLDELGAILSDPALRAMGKYIIDPSK